MTTRRHLWFAAATSLAVFSAPLALSAQSAPNSQTAQATRSRGGSTDPNIRRASVENAPGAPAGTAPAGKGTRGASAAQPNQLCFDSRVDLYIKVYVDGDYVGTMGKWGDWCGYFPSGSHRMYARADFTDGTYYSWGPTYQDASGGFSWILRP